MTFVIWILSCMTAQWAVNVLYHSGGIRGTAGFMHCHQNIL